MEEIIRVNNLTFEYSDSDTPAIKNVNFSIEKGEVIAVIGENGSGKSTLCYSLTGLIPHYFNGEFEGEVYIEALNTKESSIGDLGKYIGLVFQNPFNQLSYTTSTVAQELAYGLGNLGVAREKMIEKVNEVSKKMRINTILDKNPLELSGGQVQRLALGSSLIMDPSILVLDECTSQLDPLGSTEIFEIITDLNKEGLTVVFTDHDMERVAEIADRIIVLYEGEVVLIGTPEEVFSNDKLKDYNILPPDYYQLYTRLQEENLYNSEIVLEEKDAINMVKEVIGYDS